MLRGAADGWLATDDGTAGHAGLVTDLLRRAVRAWIDAVSVIHACGPTPMLTAVARLLRELDERSSEIPRCEVSLEAPMGCALGTCLGCVVPSADGGFARVCVEGAVMDWRLVGWGRPAGMGGILAPTKAPPPPPPPAPGGGLWGGEWGLASAVSAG